MQQLSSFHQRKGPGVQFKPVKRTQGHQASGSQLQLKTRNRRAHTSRDSRCGEILNGIPRNGQLTRGACRAFLMSATTSKALMPQAQRVAATEGEHTLPCPLLPWSQTTVTFQQDTAVGQQHSCFCRGSFAIGACLTESCEEIVAALPNLLE